jgi:hypothetical protein
MRQNSQKTYYRRGFTSEDSISAWEISVYSHTRTDMVINIPPFTTLNMNEAMEVLVALHDAVSALKDPE